MTSHLIFFRLQESHALAVLMRLGASLGDVSSLDEWLLAVLGCGRWALTLVPALVLGSAPFVFRFFAPSWGV